LNCALVTILTTVIVNIPGYIVWGDANALYILKITAIIDAAVNIIFLHLQFSYLNKYYILLCEPFRIELNAIINKQVQHSSMKLTVTAKTTTGQSSKSTETTNTSDQTSEIVRGLEPTKTDDNLNPHHLRSAETEDDFVYNTYKIYICRGCPISIERDD